MVTPPPSAQTDSHTLTDVYTQAHVYTHTHTHTHTHTLAYKDTHNLLECPKDVYAKYSNLDIINSLEISGSL